MNIDYHLGRWFAAMKVAVRRVDRLLARLGLRVRLSLTAAALALVALIAVELVTLAILRTQLYGTVDANVALEVRAFQQRVSYAATATDVDVTAREFIASDPAAASGLAARTVNKDELLRLVDRKKFQEDRIDQAEDGRVRTDPGWRRQLSR